MMGTESNDNNIVVVIGRQFGSGGRRIGRLVAQKLGAAYYDKELLLEAAVQFGFTREALANADEKRPSAIRWLLQATYGAREAFCSDSCMEGTYSAIAEVIKEISRKGPCVIVGRTADYILRDNPRMLSVFLHAPIHHRVNTLMSRGDFEAPERASEAARKADRQRESFYNYFTGRRWGHADNYHLCIDSSRISEDAIANFIVASALSKPF